jgi:MoaA/NifB/PqqE/SkfB family radical SAM enzyme
MADCVHCSFTKNKETNISDEQRKELFQEIISSGIKDITITGGEPTKVALQSILETQNLDDLYLRVCTNGFNFDEKLLNFFNENNIGYNFSFHSLDPNVQEQIYRTKTPWVKPRLDMLLKDGKKELFALNSILLSSNYHEIEHIAQYLNEQPENIRKWRILNPINTGEMMKNQQLYVDVDDVKRLRDKLSSMQLDFPVLLNADDRESKTCKIADREEVYITQYGSLRPCLGLTCLETEGTLFKNTLDELMHEKVMSYWTKNPATCLVGKITCVEQLYSRGDK